MNNLYFCLCERKVAYVSKLKQMNIAIISTNLVLVSGPDDLLALGRALEQEIERSCLGDWPHDSEIGKWIIWIGNRPLVK